MTSKIWLAVLKKNVTKFSLRYAISIKPMQLYTPIQEEVLVAVPFGGNTNTLLASSS